MLQFIDFFEQQTSQIAYKTLENLHFNHLKSFKTLKDSNFLYSYKILLINLINFISKTHKIQGIIRIR